MKTLFDLDLLDLKNVFNRDDLLDLKPVVLDLIKSKAYVDNPDIAYVIYANLRFLTFSKKEKKIVKSFPYWAH